MNTRTEAVKAKITGTAVASTQKPTTIHGFMETYKGEITKALPKHMTADRMARIAMTEFRKTPALMKCDPATLFGAVIQCSQLGLEPGGTMGHAYLIPFENRRKGVTEVQFIIGYRGMLDLARRSGQIVSISAREVCENDKFRYCYGIEETIEHIPAEGPRGELTHVYAVARLKDGGVQFEVLTRSQIEEIRNASQGYKTAVKYDRTDTPWISHFNEMAKKTAIRRLFKYLPVSIEIQRAVGLDEAAEAGISQDNGYVIDGIANEVEDNDTPSAQPQQDPAKQIPEMSFAKVADSINKAKDLDVLDVAADLIGEVSDPQQRAELAALFDKRKAELSK
jgi:recombination protein RecT